VRLSRRSAVSTKENALTRALGRARAAGQEIRDLTISNPTEALLPYPRAAILDALCDERALRYTPDPMGSIAAREAVGEAVGVAPERIMLTASTSEAYAMLLAALCDPGDRVLSPEPSYPLLVHLATLSGVALTPYALRWDGRWHVDPASVSHGLLSGARAILAVSPNNPTGSALDADDLEALHRDGVPLVVDEVFGSYPLEGDVRSAYSKEAPRIVVGGLSKLAGLPQMKVGWILVGGDDAFADALISRLGVINDAFLSVGTPAMLALARWLETRGDVSGAIRARTRDNIATLRTALGESSPITVPRVEGGWYACLRLPRTRTDEEWALRLLETDGVLVQPGYFYDFHEDGWLVVSLLTPPETFAEGVRRAVARVEAEA
jgi:aspartate/methionine/tyrosine aminotransferase